MVRGARATLITMIASAACTTTSAHRDAAAPPAGAVCHTAGDAFCDGQTAVRCSAEGSVIVTHRDACLERGGGCVAGACTVCIPDADGCVEGSAARCRGDGSGYDITESCNLGAGQGCVAGRCVNLCGQAEEERSYVGCVFYPVDLDARGAYERPFGVIVSNPNPFPTHIVLEVDDGEVGGATRPRALEELDIPAFDLEAFTFDRRRVDGRPEGDRWNETGSALTRQAYRVRAMHPVVAYQFNPMDAADVFSNDASLLLPTSAMGRHTTVNGWPQTSSRRGTLHERSDEDFRSTLTLVGTATDTTVSIRFGSAVTRVLGIDDTGPWGPGDEVTFTLDAFDTLNLETDAFLADFTGTIVEASSPVAVYMGSEGANVPLFGRVADRLCCADHLEGQLPPDRALGSRFVLARTVSRSSMINESVVDPLLRIPEVEEFEVVRVLAVEEGETEVFTDLPEPHDAFLLRQGQSATLLLDRDTELNASQRVSVLQLLAGELALGIPPGYPGGDPAMIVLPAVDQLRREYVFLTPETYAFDALTLVARPDTAIWLDGAPLPEACVKTSLDGRSHSASGSPRSWEVIRCPLSATQVGREPGRAHGSHRDGVHRLEASGPVQAIVTGFDSFVSYAYAAGMNVERLE